MIELTPIEKISALSKADVNILEQNGIKTIEALVYRGTDELEDILPNLTPSKANKIIIEALTLKNRWMVPASLWAEVEKKQLVFSTGSEALNQILGGGIRSMNVAEFYGEFGAGKSQILYTILVEALAKFKDATGVYIDCERTYSDRRMRQIARLRGYSPEEIIGRTILIKTEFTEDLIEVVKRLYLTVESRNVAIIICDSLISHLRAEYLGREMLAERQHALLRILKRLQSLASLYNLGVAVSNQVVAVPTQTFTPFGEIRPTGGHVMAHNTEPRVFVRKGEEYKRIARIVDSVWLPPAEATFCITDKGVEDVRGESGQIKR